MRSAPTLAAIERKLLGRFPHRSADPVRVAEFESAFRDSVIEAADAVANTIGVIGGKQVVELAEHFAGVLTSGISTAATQLGAAGHPWIAEGQRWAIESFFARIDALQSAMVEGGRA